MRLVAIEAGGATRYTTTESEIVQVPDDLDLADVKRQYDKWYQEEYAPAYRKWRGSPLHLDSLTGIVTPPRPAYYTFKDWLIMLHGATEKTIETGEIVTVEVVFV